MGREILEMMDIDNSPKRREMKVIAGGGSRVKRGFFKIGRNDVSRLMEKFQ